MMSLRDTLSSNRRHRAVAFCSLFAFANREIVTVSFDPFGSSDNAAFAITAPMFAVVIVFAMLGVVGGRLRDLAVAGPPPARVAHSTGPRRTDGAPRRRR